MAEQPQLAKQRDHWAGRSAFILAAIGSAVGLGNLWGFPYKLYAGGGGAFLIPYFIAMLVLGLPLMIGEFSVGHWAQQSPPGAFTRIAKQYRFVGWWLVTLAFVIITYYAVVLGWCVLLLVDSVKGMFGTELPWAVSNEAAKSYFFSTVLEAGDGLAVTGMRWPVVAGLLTSWVLIYLCLFRGVKWVSKVVLLTVPLPWLMLMVLTVRGLTLDGAVDGLKFYLEPDFTKLAEAETWRLAFGQVFFSMSLGFAVMLSYASFLHRRSDLTNNALIVGLGDLATSFIAGIAVFSTLGAMAVATQHEVTEVVKSGPTLAFVTFPFALAKLPAAQALFSSIFFIALLTLGIDSAFSIVEAVLASICDTRRKWARSIVLPAICVLGFVIGLVYCTSGGGLNWLDLIDTLVFGPMGILIAAMAESIVIGWALKRRFARRMRDHANERSDWKLYGWWEFTIQWIAPGLLLALFVWSTSDFIADRQWPVLIGMGVFALFPIVFSLFSRPAKNERTESDTRGVTTLVVVLLVAVVSGVMLGIVRLSMAKPQPAAADVAQIDVAGEQGAAPVPYVRQPAELDVSAYAVLAIAFLVIFGGLAWCFWRAMGAAGSSDTELPDETA